MLPHYSTYIYTAALKELFDTEAEVIDLEFSVVEGKFRATEKGTETSAKFDKTFLFFSELVHSLSILLQRARLPSINCSTTL